MKLDAFEIRKRLHQIPELAFQEHKTKALLIQELQRLKEITIHEFQNSPGILVELRRGEGSYLLFRADMDALPLEEKTGCAFSSLHPGMMHACGHDVHMAILLGLICLILEGKSSANFLFLFQPAEEGKGGAQSILAEGILQRYDIRAAIALHVNPKLPLGTFASREGTFFAIPQEFDVKFIGKKAHAAFPEDGKNALEAGIEFYKAMKDYVAGQTERMIFHIGKMESGVIRNVVPDICTLEGTHRTLSQKMRNHVNDQIRVTAKAIAEKHKLDYVLDFLCSYEAVVNDANLVKTLKDTCEELGYRFMEAPVAMTGEDFGYFTAQYPGLLFWLGANDPEHDLHSEYLLPDEAAIAFAIRLLYRYSYYI